MATQSITAPLGTPVVVHSSGILSSAWADLGVRPLAFCLLHAPLALMMYQHEQVAKLHALVTVLCGVWWAVCGRLEECAYVIAYIVGAEVLWRMTDGSLAWEMGKYATSAILLTALLVRRIPFSVMPVFYFAAFLPSAVLTLAESVPAVARKQISFNLSGPLALMAAVCFFSRLKMSRTQIQRLLLSILGPIVGIATVTISAIHNASSIEFTTESNLVTSGGFGPNQVSSMLGLGTLLAFLLLLQMRGLIVRSLLLVATAVFATQSMMTFSRNGIYLACAAGLGASFLMMRERRARFALVVGGMLLATVMACFILPRLDAFTDGNLSARFMDTEKSGRVEVFDRQLEIWRRRPIFGVGPGLSKLYQQRWFKTSLAAHTEFSRMLSEHGVFGLIALIVLGVLGCHALRQTRNHRELALVAATLIFSCLYLYVNAMRLAAPSFLFGLAFLRESHSESETVPANDATENVKEEALHELA